MTRKESGDIKEIEMRKYVDDAAYPVSLASRFLKASTNRILQEREVEEGALFPSERRKPTRSDFEVA